MTDTDMHMPEEDSKLPESRVGEQVRVMICYAVCSILL